MPNQNILLIEDDPDTVKLLEILLKFEHFNIQIPTVITEAAVLDILQKQSFTALIIDVKLRHLDGIKLVRQIRQKTSNSHSLIVMISGLELSDRCLEAGADYFFQKPFEPSKLIAAIKSSV